MRLVISSLALIALLACEKKVEQVVPTAVSSESTETLVPSETEVADDAGLAAAPTVPATPVETTASSASCPPSCFVNGTMQDSKPVEPTSGGTTSK